VATIDFIASGGDGYKAFGDAITSSRDYAVVGGAMKGEKVVYSDPGTMAEGHGRQLDSISKERQPSGRGQNDSRGK